MNRDGQDFSLLQHFLFKTEINHGYHLKGVVAGISEA